jgi:hypothetical protein
MTSIFEKNTVPVDDDDDDWEPISIPVEDDPTITAADLERFRQTEERIKQGHCITMSFNQLRRLLHVLDEP